MDTRRAIQWFRESISCLNTAIKSHCSKGIVILTDHTNSIATDFHT